MEYTKLGDVISNAKTVRCGDNEYPVLSITKKDGIVLQSEKFNKRIASKDTDQYKVVKRGKLVQGIHIDEANFGIQDIVDAGIVSPAYKIWDVDTDKIFPKYLEYVLRSPRSIRYYASKFNGRVKRRERISDSEFLDMDIPFPTLREQQYAVEVMLKVCNLVEFRKKELDLYDDLIKARFVELFGNPVINDKGWSTDSCKNLMSKIGSGATPKGGRDSYCDEGISLIRSMNVYNNRFEYKDLAHITDEQAEQLDNVTIEKSDVLLNITGASVARCCVVPDNLIPARVNQHVSIIRCKESLLPEFVCSMFTEDNYQRLLWNIATAGGATREAITKQQIEDLVLIVPPIDLQKQFMEFVKQVDKSKVAVQKALDETQRLFDSLMQEYFG